MDEKPQEQHTGEATSALDISESVEVPSSWLPSPQQKWAHSTCSKKDLCAALNDASVTALEADVLLGYHTVGDSLTVDSSSKQAIMAHPPSTTSDLTLNEFLSQPNLKRIIKLDLKQVEVVKPALDCLQDTLKSRYNHVDPSTAATAENQPMTIFFNADVLPGPGKRDQEATVNAHQFLSGVLNHACHDWKPCTHVDVLRFAFSLGWSVDAKSFSGYSNEDVQQMMSLIVAYDLFQKSAGVVLAVNARVLGMSDLSVFQRILSRYPTQLLVWTGVGEPPIPQSLVRHLKLHFEKHGFIDRIGFDCSVS